MEPLRNEDGDRGRRARRDRAFTLEVESARYARLSWLVLLLAALAATACGRTGLGYDDYDAQIWFLDAGPDAAPLADAGPDATPLPDAGHDAPGCVPKPETCNGVDDDCNGVVDDGIASVACEGGGQSYCVAGHMSQCPKRCEACVPGSERVCFLSYCRYWGTQTCAADGRGFGYCHEASPPSECKSVASDHQDSSELEQCCVDAGYCCIDTYDLDHDGNHSEMLGQCDNVTCGP